jgi:hypothetical protein
LLWEGRLKISLQARSRNPTFARICVCLQSYQLQAAQGAGRQLSRETSSLLRRMWNAASSIVESRISTAKRRTQGNGNMRRGRARAAQSTYANGLTFSVLTPFLAFDAGNLQVRESVHASFALSQCW